MIIICGVPGSGKTTISKSICAKQNFLYVNDFELLKKSGKNKLSKESLFEFISSPENENVVLDLDYSNAETDYLLPRGVPCIYLGFKPEDKPALIQKYVSNGRDEVEANELASKHIDLCKFYTENCEKLKLKFFTIEKRRDKTIEAVINYVSAKYSAK